MNTGCLDYQMTRRRMLGLSSATLLGMPIASMLARAGETKKATCEHVILFWNGGGMSHIDTWDPKPGREVAGEFDPIDTSADGIQISGIFPKLAKQMHHAALIRSIAGTNGAHGRASSQLQTSYNQSASLIHPGIGSIVAHEKDRLGDLPSFITISGNARRAGYLGQRCEAYFVGRPGEKDPYLAFPAGITQLRGNKRLDILARMNLRNARGLDADKAKAVDTATREAVNLMRSPALKAFELKGEDPKTVARYGDTPFGRGALLARRLVETGVRFVQVAQGGWDLHGGIAQRAKRNADQLDPAIGALMDDLKDRGMFEDTLIYITSEFGRTPREDGRGGRGHNKSAMSTVLAGGGIKGGMAYGSTDEIGGAVEENPVHVKDIHATILNQLGFDHEQLTFRVGGRPFRLTQPIQEGGQDAQVVKDIVA